MVQGPLQGFPDLFSVTTRTNCFPNNTKALLLFFTVLTYMLTVQNMVVDVLRLIKAKAPNSTSCHCTHQYQAPVPHIPIQFCMSMSFMILLNLDPEHTF